MGYEGNSDGGLGKVFLGHKKKWQWMEICCLSAVLCQDVISETVVATLLLLRQWSQHSRWERRVRERASGCGNTVTRRDGLTLQKIFYVWLLLCELQMSFLDNLIWIKNICYWKPNIYIFKSLAFGLWSEVLPGKSSEMYLSEWRIKRVE